MRLAPGLIQRTMDPAPPHPPPLGLPHRFCPLHRRDQFGPLGLRQPKMAGKMGQKRRRWRHPPSLGPLLESLHRNGRQWPLRHPSPPRPHQEIWLQANRRPHPLLRTRHRCHRHRRLYYRAKHRRSPQALRRSLPRHRIPRTCTRCRHRPHHLLGRPPPWRSSPRSRHRHRNSQSRWLHPHHPHQPTTAQLHPSVKEELEIWDLSLAKQQFKHP